MSQVSGLPLEIVLCIVDKLVDDPRCVLKPSHPTTKTLLSFTRVCRGTYTVASNHLRKHCVYINSRLRLDQLLYCIEATRGRTRSSVEDDDARSLKPITALYLAPFDRSTANDAAIVHKIATLFGRVHTTLTRLVINMPLHSIRSTYATGGVRRTLREAFLALTALEDLVSLRDELFLYTMEVGEEENEDIPEPEPWRAWPRLKRLALDKVNADENFWKAVRGTEALEQVVLTRADSLEEVCMKRAYLGLHREGELPRPLRVVLVNVSMMHPDQLAGESNWGQIDPSNLVDVVAYDVPVSFYGDESHPELCRAWVKAAALRDELWSWEGTPVGPRRVDMSAGEEGAQASELYV
ncbi:hypothetical protein M406DRAFT_340358 [Cryphonectria parasitica EP155]|uniref:F-box domain-containing protein n=1 Tax=Cryphonectria parasitica (strain ATCC 38755 / EP155) TaxID=660469 RepID=A0A9P4Y1I7_CRYP1|nr:uncharacterized protein M406DRAFT_340358 [Cryphonectria parasitica EP155]KAF3764831.1 hypothetical protein M406DRAFT_340358 [Cryphonectria parasitica EP155]